MKTFLFRIVLCFLPVLPSISWSAQNTAGPRLGNISTSFSSLALSRDGSLYYWGFGSPQQVAHVPLPMPTNSSFWTQVTAMQNAPQSATTSGDLTPVYSLTEHGMLYQWMRKKEGNLVAVPVIFPPGPHKVSSWQSVKAGHFFLAGMASDHELYLTGYRFGPFLNRWNKPAGVTSWLQYAAGAGHVIALGNDGTIYGFGDNDASQLGDGVPQVIGTGGVYQSRALFTETHQFVAVEAGRKHSLALTANGRLFAWGDNQFGQCGQYRTLFPTVMLPMEIPAPDGKRWSRISAGGNHNLAMLSDGSLVAWGFGIEGALGTGLGETTFFPQAVHMPSKVKGWQHFTAGHSHSMAISSDGFVYVWGRNQENQAGDGTQLNKFYPTLVSSLPNLNLIGKPTVYLSLIQGSMAEGSPGLGMVDFYRTGDINQELIVQLKLGGTATPQVDYHSETRIQIPAGKRSARLYLKGIEDSIPEGTETIQISLAPSATYNLATPAEATLRIEDNDSEGDGRPVLQIYSRKSETREGNEVNAPPAETAGLFEIVRTGAQKQELRVSFKIGGSAQNGRDYQQIADGVRLEAGQASAWVRIQPIDDELVEGVETVELHLVQSESYHMGPSRAAKVAIVDNDSSEPPPPPPPNEKPVVTLSVVDGEATEVPDSGEPPPVPDDARIRIVLNSPFPQTTTVRYQLSGTAVNGEDYRRLSGEAIFEPSRNAMTLNILPIDDAIGEGNESVILTLLEGEGYTLGESKVVEVILRDNEPQTMAAASAEKSEDGNWIMSFPATKGTAYQLEVSEDLIRWNPVRTVVAEGSLLRFVESQPFDSPQRFYRLRREN